MGVGVTTFPNASKHGPVENHKKVPYVFFSTSSSSSRRTTGAGVLSGHDGCLAGAQK